MATPRQIEVVRDLLEGWCRIMGVKPMPTFTDELLGAEIDKSYAAIPDVDKMMAEHGEAQTATSNEVRATWEEIPGVNLYNPNQPRVPEGEGPKGGEWTSSTPPGSPHPKPLPASLEEAVFTAPTDKGTLRYKKKDGSWDDSRKQIHEKIKQKFRENVTNQDTDGTLYMTGGGFGAGKSTLLDDFPEAVGFPSKDRAARADPDAAKKLIPEMAQRASLHDAGAASYVHEESADVAKETVREELEKGHSVVYDTSGDGTPESLKRKVDGFRANGAKKVVAHYATPGSIDEAISRVKGRAEAEARAGKVPRKLTDQQVKENHKQVAQTWAAALANGTYDEQHLWSTDVPKGQPPKHIAMFKDGKMTVFDQPSYERFLAMGE